MHLEQDLNNSWMVNGQYIRQPDLLAQWGVIHYLDDELNLSYEGPRGPIGMDDQQVEIVTVEGDIVPLAIGDNTRANGATALLRGNTSWWMGATMALIAIILA